MGILTEDAACNLRGDIVIFTLFVIFYICVYGGDVSFTLIGDMLLPHSGKAGERNGSVCCGALNCPNCTSADA